MEKGNFLHGAGVRASQVARELFASSLIEHSTQTRLSTSSSYLGIQHALIHKHSMYIASRVQTSIFSTRVLDESNRTQSSRVEA